MALEPLKSSKLSMDEKRELVYDLSKRNDAAEMLQTWRRQDILQILCAEMGKERKYTGLTKLKIIENLLKIVSKKKAGEDGPSKSSETTSSPVTGEKTSKRQRKTDIPFRLPVQSTDSAAQNIGNDWSNILYCKNSACKAAIKHGDAFCKRCSCCICHKYDDNKDPSLWLVCSSDPPFVGESCGMSCHLECALKHESAGIGKGKHFRDGLDGTFYCAFCGKVNDLLGCWRKQLTVAKDTRRVDILCYRVSLGQKLLNGTTKYLKLLEIVDQAVKKLEAEVGTLSGLPVKMGRGIVNRLPSGAEVQKLCDFALQSLDQMLFESILYPVPNPIIKDTNLTDPTMFQFEDVGPTSLTLVLGHEEPYPANFYSYNLWHRRACDMDYPVKPISSLSTPTTRFQVTGLTPATEYYLKIVCFNGTREIGNCEVPFLSNRLENDDVTGKSVVKRSQSQSPTINCSSLSNPSSVEDETNNVDPEDNFNDLCKGTDKNGSANLTVDDILLGDGRTDQNVVSLPNQEQATDTGEPISHSDVMKGKLIPQCGTNGEEVATDNGTHIIGTEAILPITPCKMETLKGGRSKSNLKDVDNRTMGTHDGSTSEKNVEERDNKDGLSDQDFEHCVKVIRWLECKGHIEKNFRQKFLTWYTLRANLQEVRIVKIFVDTFSEDPGALAEQLVDTFSETISSKKACTLPAGFCTKLWH
ncbi:hypothetical protein ACFE04_026776 [Oxalis oulophora]